MLQDLDPELEAIRAAAPVVASRADKNLDPELEAMRRVESGGSLADMGFKLLTDQDIDQGFNDLQVGRGFLSNIVPTGKDVPFLGMGFQIEDAVSVQRGLARMQIGKATIEDERAVWRWMVSEARKNTSGGTIAELIKSVGTSGVEILTGAGATVAVGKGAAKAATKTGLRALLSKSLAESAQDAVSKKVEDVAVSSGLAIAARAAGKGAATIGATVGLQEAVPRVAGMDGGAWTAQSVMRAVGMEMTPEQAQQVADDANAAMPMLLEAGGGLINGMIRQGIQMGSEATGGLLGKLPVVKQVDLAFGMLFKKLSGRAGAVGWQKALAEAAKFQGPGGEVAEEFFAAGAEAAVMGDKPILEALAEVAEITPEMLASFAVPGAAGAGITRATRRRGTIQPSAPKALGSEEGGGPAPAAPEASVEGAAAVEAPEGQAAGIMGSPLAPGEVPSDRPLPTVEQRDPEAGEIRGALSAPPMLADVQASPGIQTAPKGQATTTQGSIGRGLVGTLQPTTDRTTNPVRIMDALADVVEASGGDTPIRSGRVRTKWAAGHFDVNQETIELLRSNDIAVASHEVAHAIEKHIFGSQNPWKAGAAAGLDAIGRRELAQLGRQLYGSQYPKGGYRREGWAEYVRMWATEGGAQNTPNVDAWFTKFLESNPKVAQALENVRDLSTVWRTQGSVNRGREMIARPEKLSERVRKVRQAVASGAISSKVYDQWIDQFGPLERITAEAERKKGSKITTSEDPFSVASALRQTAPARARYMAEHGMIHLAGVPTGGPSLAQIKPLVAKRYEDFIVYLYARRARALIEDPQGARDPGISIEDANQIIQELGSADFQRAADIVYRWNDGLLSYMAEASSTLASGIDRIRKRDPGAYVPLKREFDEIERRARGTKGPAKSGKVSDRLKGSGRRILDPFPQMLEAAEKRITVAHERLIIERVLAFRNIEGMGHLIEEVPVDRVPAASRTVGQLLEEIGRKGAKGSTQALEDAANQAGIALDQQVTLFEQSLRPTKSDETPIVPVIVDGKIRYYRIGDRELYESLEGLDVYRLPKFLDWVFGMPKRLVVSGVTSLSASFGLIANPARDFQVFMANTQASNPVMAAAGWTQMAAHQFASAATLGKYRSDWQEIYESMGVVMARRLSADSAPTRRAARRLAGHRVVDLRTPGDMLDVFRDFIQFSEGAPRMAEMQTVAERVGWAPGQPMSLAQSIEIILAGKRVTTDFSAAGKLARVANSAIPFFNVAIQGVRATVLAARRNPLRYVTTGFTMLTIPAVALWLMQNDEDWYDEMSDEERYTHFYFRVGSEVFRFPRAHDVGFVFASLPEILLNRWKKDDPKGAVEWAKSIIGYTGESAKEAWRVLVPDSMPVLVGLAAEQLANRSFFWDSPIVSQGLQTRPTEEQFDDYTSQASIAIGNALGLSPKRVDHAIRYLTGTVGTETLAMFGRGVDDAKLEPELADAPLVGRLFRRGGSEGGRSKYVDQLFDLSHEALVRSRSRRTVETPEQQQERLLLTDATKAVAALSHARSITSSADARRVLAAEASKIARDAMKATESGEALRRRGEFQRARSVAERQEAQAESALAQRRAQRGSP